MPTTRVPVRDGELQADVRGSGPPLVLLHGGLLDLRMWDGVVAELAASFQVIRYDARSHGGSSTATGDYSPAEDLGAVLAATAPDGAVLVGLSLGARAALDFALRVPGRVRGLVLVSPGMSGMRFVDPFVLDRITEQQKAKAAGDADAFVEAFLRLWVDGPNRQPAEVDASARQACRTMAADNVATHHTAVGGLLEEGAADRLAELRPPLLAVTGGLDSTDITRVADALTAVPGAEHRTIDGVGHTLVVERPAEFRTVVSPFLASLR